MKLVIATPLYPPDLGGPATYAKLLADGLPSRGIDVALVKFGDVRHLPKLVRHLAYFARVRRALNSADLVLALDPVSTGLPACLAAWSLKKPFVVKVVGDYAWEQGRQRAGITVPLDAFVRMKQVPFLVWFWRAVQTGVARYARRVIVPSAYLKGVVAAWGIPEKEITIVYNAVSVETGGSVPEAVAHARRPLVVTAGRLVPWKHVDGVIDAVAALLARGTHASLAIVGDGPERARLTARAQEKLGDTCVFTGALAHADLMAVVRQADACVLNSSYEGLSHLLVEALVLGVPTVATRAGGNAEVIEDGETGLLVPVGDPPALAAALARVLSDAPLVARLRASARASAEHFSVDGMLEETVAVCRAVMTS
jgi:glycosyltransferase involved in cell wall biosynthesis